MLEMVKSEIRGGIVQAVYRRSITNNRYLPEYDSSQPSVYNIYFDAVNLYRWVMMQLMPVGGHQWVPNGAMTHDGYERVLLEGEKIYQNQLSFRLTGHVMTLRLQNKLVLSQEDDK